MKPLISLLEWHKPILYIAIENGKTYICTMVGNKELYAEISSKEAGKLTKDWKGVREIFRERCNDRALFERSQL